MNVNLSLNPDQVGLTSIVLTVLLLASIDAQRAAPPVVTPPAGGTAEWTYPFNQLNDDDRRWLRAAQDEYAHAIALAPHIKADGSKWTGNQLIPDLLTSNGKTLWQMTGAAMTTFQQQQSVLINRIRAGGDLYDINYGAAQQAAYQGPLRARMANLVARKNAGL